MEKWYRLFNLLGSNKKKYGLSVLLVAAILAALDVSMAPIIDHLLSAAIDQKVSLLIKGMIIAAVSVLVASFGVPVLQYFYTTSVRKAINELRENAVRRLLKSFADQSVHSSEVLSILTNDLVFFEELFSETLVKFITQLLLAFFAVCTILLYNVYLGCGIIAAAWLGSLVNTFFAKRAALYAENSMKGTADLLSAFSDMTSGFAIVKIFSLEKKFSGIMDKYNRSIFHAGKQTAWVRGSMEVYGGLVKTVMYTGILVVGLMMIQRSALTFGKMAAILQLTSIITIFFYQFGHMLSGIQQSFAAIKRVESILARPAEPELSGFSDRPDWINRVDPNNHAHQGLPFDFSDLENESALNVDKWGRYHENSKPDDALLEKRLDLRNHDENLVVNTQSTDSCSDETLALCLQHVSVSIEDHLILDQLSLKIKKNSFIALVGPSGSGKTTLFFTLLGFLEPQSGSLHIMGESVTGKKRNEIRSSFAYVPQDSWLFNSSIRENIRLGFPTATEENVLQASKESGAHQFIIQLPNGYDTIVGIGGENLSGGQRQRVAIARAIISAAPILLLDEPTSSLDRVNEKEIMLTLHQLKKSRTILLATHRQNVIQEADELVYFHIDHVLH